MSDPLVEDRGLAVAAYRYEGWESGLSAKGDTDTILLDAKVAKDRRLWMTNWEARLIMFLRILAVEALAVGDDEIRDVQ